MCVVDKIREIPDILYIGFTKEPAILDAEMELGIEFPQAYLNYLRAFGSVNLCGHQLTGLRVEGMGNVVTATEYERISNPNMPFNMFVLENVGIDGMAIVMDLDGAVFLLQHETLRRIADSLSEYIDFIT